METAKLAALISSAYEDRSQLHTAPVRAAIESAISQLDSGKLRVAQYDESQGAWVTHAWLKQAILLYFAVAEMHVMEVGPFEFYDKIPLKKRLHSQGVRVVPPGAVRYGAHLERGTVVMPAYVNIGAYVGQGTMVDTWATVGSCAQVGRNVHLSGGVGIGGVLEPPQAAPVILEDDVFVGSRCVVVEGVHVGRAAVLGAGVVLTASTTIIDVRGPEQIVSKGYIPPRSVVIPGVRQKTFPAGSFGVPCALIVGERSAQTDQKTSLNQALRDFEVAV